MRLGLGSMACLLLLTFGTARADKAPFPPFALRFKTRLQLTDAQMNKMRPLFNRIESDAEKREANLVAQVRTILRPQQVKQLDTLRAAQIKAGNQFHPIDFRRQIPLDPIQINEITAWRRAEKPAVEAEKQRYRAAINTYLTPKQKTLYADFLKRKEPPPPPAPTPHSGNVPGF